MKVFYDTEFLEDGIRIDLISIGLVREDGAEYYAVSQDVTRGRLLRRIRKHEWLMANVVPSLPRAHGDWNLHQPKGWLFNYSSPHVRPRHVIAREVRDFILAAPDPELWADWGAYDHVVLCQLWGRMIDLPDGIPMWTHDLRQEWERLGRPELPRLSAVTAGMAEHNALHDAREVRSRHEWLMTCGATAETGLDRAAKAVRKSRGGNAPVHPRGFA